uniref:Glycine-rich cell wall structural protein 1 isoform X2 n=1 Tax=Diabrotica virgifera virgifera TaxID=50390 RepID=A0A6P7FU72_DIAVI
MKFVFVLLIAVLLIQGQFTEASRDAGPHGANRGNSGGKSSGGKSSGGKSSGGSNGNGGHSGGRGNGNGDRGIA